MKNEFGYSSDKTKTSMPKKRTIFFKFVLGFAVCLTIVIGSMVTAGANNVPFTVVDFEKQYSFTVQNQDFETIINSAIELGMAPVGENDRVYINNGIVTVDRAIAVTIVVNDKKTETFTYKGNTVMETLEELDVYYEETSKISLDLDTVLTSETEITIQNPIQVIIDFNGEKFTDDVFGGTIREVLDDEKIMYDEDDIISPSLDTVITENMTISVSSSTDILFVDGTSDVVEFSTFAITVGEFLEQSKIVLGEFDILSCELKAKLKDEMLIEIIRVEYVETTVTESIERETVYEYDDSMYEGETRTKQTGYDGTASVTYSERYENGVLVNSDIVEQEIISEAKEKIVVQGTKELVNDFVFESVSTDSTFTDMYGSTVSYSKVLTGECTAYTSDGGITSLGEVAEVGIVAVNPNVIPYGTRLYITSGGVVYGYAVAGDTGGALISNTVLIDLYYDTEAECIDFGRRDMTVYILD
ncbi:MAG: G5 domain-containing protein [Clostridia bacterium]